MLLKRAAQNLAEMRHLKAVDPSGAQTCPALLPDDLVQRKNTNTHQEDPVTRSILAM